jgi:hypothetical protein
MRLYATVVMILMLGLSAREFAAQKAPSDQPETVEVTFHALQGAEYELARAIARHSEMARRLNLVREMPHVTIRGTEEGDRTSFVDVFTWRDASIPDAAPPALQAIWAEMNKLVEPREGKRAIEIAQVELIN